MRIAARFGLQHCLYWPVTEAVSCRFSDLFEMPVDEVQAPQGNAAYFSWRLWVAKDELPQGWARAYPADDVSGRAIDFEFDRIPQPLRQGYLDQIARLQPLRDLVRRAEAPSAGEFVSVHVRDGKDWEAWGRTAPLENFLAALDRFPPSTRFFVSAHAPATVELLSRRYPGRVLRQDGKQYDGSSIQRMQGALVDLLCLARGTQLVGTFGSTFTDMAWWLGGCRQTVTIVQGGPIAIQMVLRRSLAGEAARTCARCKAA